MFKVFDVYSGVTEKVSWQDSEILEHPYSKIARSSSPDLL